MNQQYRIFYRTTDRAYQPSWALNLSPEGARLVIHDRVATGTDLELWVHVGRECFRVRAEKVWETPFPGGMCRVVGVVFRDFPEERRAELERRLAPPESTRAIFESDREGAA